MNKKAARKGETQGNYPVSGVFLFFFMSAYFLIPVTKEDITNPQT